MQSSGDIEQDSSSGESPPMFLHQLSSFSSSILPRSRPALCRAGLRSSSASSSSSSSSSYPPHSIPPPPPWCSMQGFPPRPPRLPRYPPAAYQVYSGRTLHPHSVNPGGGSWRPFSTSDGLRMERPDREPPHKRRKSEEERRSTEEREHRGGAAGGQAKDGDGRPRTKHRFRDGSRDRGKNGAGKGFSWDKDGGRTKDGNKDGGRTKDGNKDGGRTKDGNKDGGRTKDGNKDGGRTKDGNKDGGRTKDGNKDGASCHETPNRGRGSQPATSRTQTSSSTPEQDKGAMQRPNPWFREKQGGERSRTGPGGQLEDRCNDGQQWTGRLPRPGSTTRPPNPWQVAGADRTPPPPGTCPPDGQQEDVKPVKSLQRHWETSPVCSTDTRPPGDSTAFDFSVMSYNILSQELLQDNVYLYRHCKPGVLPWGHRLPNLLAEIQQHDADILCLQEVQVDHYENQIRPALQARGYQCEFKKRTGSKPDGCAVIFKTSRLSLVSSNPVEYFRRGDALLDRDNVGLVALLQPNDAAGQSDPSAFICVANTHLLYNPRRGDIKLAQLAILLAEIGRLSRLPDGSTNPVVLCGDLNSIPHSPLYSFLTTGRLTYRGLQIGTVSGQEDTPRGQRVLTSPLWSHSLGINHRCQYEDKSPPAESSSPSSPTAVEGAISSLTVEDVSTKAVSSFNRAQISHSLKLQSSYQHRLKPDGRPEITTWHSRTATTVDYILYSPESITPPSLPGGRGLQLLGRLSLVGQSELEEVNGLPNRYHSSDHLPLLARFRLRR